MSKVARSQKELDVLIDSGFDGLIIIKDTIEEVNVSRNGKSQIDVYDSGRVGSVYDSGRVGSVYGSGRVGSVSGSGRVGYVSMNAQIDVYGKDVKIDKATDDSIIVLHDLKSLKFKKSKSVQVLKVKTYQETSFDIAKFTDRYQAEKDGKYLILYKSVNPDTDCDFYTGKVKYEIGKTVSAPDWDKHYTSECGAGLHLCPAPFLALSFNDGKVLKCRVKKTDCKTVSSPQYPHKVRCNHVEVLEKVKPADYF